MANDCLLRLVGHKTEYIKAKNTGKSKNDQLELVMFWANVYSTA